MFNIYLIIFLHSSIHILFHVFDFQGDLYIGIFPVMCLILLYLMWKAWFDAE